MLATCRTCRRPTATIECACLATSFMYIVEIENMTMLTGLRVFSIDDNEMTRTHAAHGDPGLAIQGHRRRRHGHRRQAPHLRAASRHRVPGCDHARYEWLGTVGLDRLRASRLRHADDHGSQQSGHGTGGYCQGGAGIHRQTLHSRDFARYLAQGRELFQGRREAAPPLPGEACG